MLLLLLLEVFVAAAGHVAPAAGGFAPAVGGVAFAESGAAAGGVAD